MAVTPGHGWPIPDLANVADGPDGFSDLAIAIENTLDSRSQQSYTPAWASLGSVQPANPSARQGLYRVIGPNCYFNTVISFGASTTGGKGALRVSIPVPASTAIAEQWVICTLLTPGSSTRWQGIAQITSAANTWCNPTFCSSSTENQLANWMGSQESTVAGYPSIGVATVQNGGHIRINGFYAVA